MTDIESMMSDHWRMEDEKSFKKTIRRQENGGDSRSSSDEEEVSAHDQPLMIRAAPSANIQLYDITQLLLLPFRPTGLN